MVYDATVVKWVSIIVVCIVATVGAAMIRSCDESPIPIIHMGVR